MWSALTPLIQLDIAIRSVKLIEPAAAASLRSSALAAEAALKFLESASGLANAAKINWAFRFNWTPRSAASVTIPEANIEVTRSACPAAAASIARRWIEKVP